MENGNKQNMNEEFFSVKDGDIVTFDVLEWREDGWEFGSPCVMLSPVIRYDTDKDSESLIESVCLDICSESAVGGAVKIRLSGDSDLREFEWRGWNLKTLRRRFNESLAGKEFPKKGYAATKVEMKFSLEPEHSGDEGKRYLTWGEA